MDQLEDVERSIAVAQDHIERQRQIIDVLHKHGDEQHVPMAEELLETLTTGLEALNERKAVLEAGPARKRAKPRLTWIFK